MWSLQVGQGQWLERLSHSHLPFLFGFFQPNQIQDQIIKLLISDELCLSWAMKLPSLSWPVRWESSLLIFFGLICNYAMRLNISIAILQVVKNLDSRWSARWLESNCFQMSNSTSTPMWPLQNYSPISWGSEDRALILGAFFYGYVVFQVHFASRSSNLKNSGAWGADGRDVRNEEGAWIQVCLSMKIFRMFFCASILRFWNAVL